MFVLVTCENEDPIKNDGIKSDHNIIHQFLRRSRAAYSIIGEGIWLKFKLIQAFISVLITSTNEEDSSKNEGTRVVRKFLPL